MHRLFSILTLSFITFGAHAHFLDLPDDRFRETCLRATYTEMSFIRPNETMPQRAKPILEKAPSGAYISVGTERAIFGAIQSPKVTHLIFLDHSSHICAFNNINIALLKLSKGDIAFYRHLRHKATFKEWSDLVAENSGLLTDLEKRFLGLSQFDFWTDSIRQRPSVISFEDPPQLNHFIDGTHYLYDEKAYQRVYQLVKENKVDAIQLELKDKEGMSALGAAMKKIGLYTSVLDISNAWEISYLGFYGIYPTVQEMKKHYLLHDESFVLGTGDEFELGKEEQNIPNEHTHNSLFSRYTAYTFNFFQKNQMPFSSESYDGVIDNKSEASNCQQALTKKLSKRGRDLF